MVVNTISKAAILLLGKRTMKPYKKRSEHVNPSLSNNTNNILMPFRVVVGKL